MDWLKAILSSGQVWSALLLFINTLLFIVWPAFPRDLWAALNGVVIAILGAMGISGVKAKVNTMRAVRQRNPAG